VLRTDVSEQVHTTVSAPQVTRYRYDGAHQLVGIEHADGGRTEYQYDARGRRIAKRHTPVGEVPRLTLFVWDGDWMIQEVRAGANAREDAAVTYIAHPDHHGPLARLADGKRYHYLNDHFGGWETSRSNEPGNVCRPNIGCPRLIFMSWTTAR
jgi:type VI secretion system secreted protein VgrG